MSLHNGKKDQAYIIDLCDEVLGQKAQREHRFPFLLGDRGRGGRQMTLPVDAYYSELKLVIEYHEPQHFGPHKFFDKPHRMTVSGVDRGKQREKYDRRRREVLPQNGITLVELRCLDFARGSNKRLRRLRTSDIEVIRKRLADFMSRGVVEPHSIQSSQVPALDRSTIAQERGPKSSLRLNSMQPLPGDVVEIVSEAPCVDMGFVIRDGINFLKFKYSNGATLYVPVPAANDNEEG